MPLAFFGTYAVLGLEPTRKGKKGLRERIAPICTLSQNGYGTYWLHRMVGLRQDGGRVSGGARHGCWSRVSLILIAVLLPVWILLHTFSAFWL